MCVYWKISCILVAPFGSEYFMFWSIGFCICVLFDVYMCLIEIYIKMYINWLLKRIFIKIQEKKKTKNKLSLEPKFNSNLQDLFYGGVIFFSSHWPNWIRTEEHFIKMKKIIWTIDFWEKNFYGIIRCRMNRIWLELRF